MAEIDFSEIEARILSASGEVKQVHGRVPRSPPIVLFPGKKEAAMDIETVDFYGRELQTYHRQEIRFADFLAPVEPLFIPRQHVAGPRKVNRKAKIKARAANKAARRARKSA